MEELTKEIFGYIENPEYRYEIEEGFYKGSANVYIYKKDEVKHCVLFTMYKDSIEKTEVGR